MFSLTLRDHLRLTFIQVIQRHKAHTKTAQRYARWNRWLRGSEAFLMGAVSVLAVMAATGRGQVFAIVAASLAGAALIVLLVHLTFDFDASARTHAACSAELWQMRERYRALLSDLHDGAFDISEARVRRDKLIDDLRAIYEKTPATHLEDFQNPRSAAGEQPDVVDEEVNLFLPKLEKTEEAV